MGTMVDAQTSRRAGTEGEPAGDRRVPVELATAAWPLARHAAEPWLARHRRVRWAAVVAVGAVLITPLRSVPAVVGAALIVLLVTEAASRRVIRSLVPTIAAAVDAFGHSATVQLVHGFRRSWSRPPAGGATALIETWHSGMTYARRAPDCTTGHDLFCSHRPAPEAIPKPWWPPRFVDFAADLAA